MHPVGLEPAVSSPDLSDSGESENPVPGMACTFPEFLVHDLEASTAVFAAKDMTAGAPVAVFSLKTLQAMPPRRLGSLSLAHAAGPDVTDSEYAAAPSPGIRYQHLPYHMRTLEPIEEQAQTLDDHSRQIEFMRDDDESDWDSISSSHSSGVLEPSSTRTREVSVMTAATSLLSDRLSRSSSHNRASVDGCTETSWIDEGSDSDSDDVKPQEDQSRPSSILSSRKRLPVRLSAESVALEQNTSMIPSVEEVHPTGARPMPAPQSKKADEAKSLYSIRISKRLGSRRRRGVRIVSDIPYSSLYSKSKATLNDVQAAAEHEDDPAMPSLVPFDSIIDLRGRANDPTCSASATERQREPLDTLESASEGEDDDLLASDCQDTSHAKLSQVSMGAIDSRAEALGPSQSLEGGSALNVQAWLESSAGLMANGRGDDPAALGIPLPPDVVDNVRVSITCFPDTMLLSSSLSVDTIRAYARKLKTPMIDLDGDNSPNSTYQSPRRWGLSRIRSRRSIGTTTAAMQETIVPSSPLDEGAPISSLRSGVTTPWVSFRTIFSAGSDYLCDALYAHIVVYNYIASLCPKPVPSAPKTPATRGKPRRDGDDREIPQKAAAFLGIGDSKGRPGTVVEPQTPAIPSRPGTSSSSLYKLRRGKASSRAPSVLSLERTPLARSAKVDIAMRELLMGLARCIVRLIYTLREGRTDVVSEEEAAAVRVDPFLVRALCEIVRTAEGCQ